MDSQQLRQTGEDYLIRSSLLSDVVAASGGPVFVRAEGSEVWDRDGNAYLDFNSGQMCSWLGHNNPHVTAAVQKGLGELTHASSVYYNEPQVLLAKKLAETLDAPLTRSLFIQSGADSNEAAILFARRATGKSGIAALHLSFHGYSDVSRAMSYVAAAPNHGPTIPDLYAIPAPYAYRSPIESEGDDWWRPLLDISFETLDRQCAGNLAAVIVEPVAGSAGVLVPPKGYLERLRAICDKHGLLLIFDEVITGFGRLGTSFAGDRFGVVPDLMTTAKGLTNATVPMGAVFCRKFIHDAFMQGDNTHAVELTHGYTYSAHPLAAAAGLATLDVYQEEGLFQRAADLAPYWEEAVHAMKGLPNVIDVRNIGLVAGIELSAREGAPGKRGMEACIKAYEAGLMVRVTGDIIALSPPLILEKSHIDEMVEITSNVIKELD